MAKQKPKLGTRYTCYSCVCSFYDLGKSKALCPKCGADQANAPKFVIPADLKVPSSKSRDRSRVRQHDDDDDSNNNFDEFDEVILEDDDIDYEEEDDE
ncbi:MAG: FYDLN acid domain-containing protein [Deltaproteobacteria bacterium]|nr:FYDLN acid domain-containing protein [Deltaproteobacteria bacterium]